MKKLLLILFISLGLIGSAIAVTYTPDGFGGYRGSDGTRWTPDGFGGMRGSNGVNCKKDYYGAIKCSGGYQDNNGWDNITNASGGIGASFGQALGELFSSFGQSNNQTTTKSNFKLPENAFGAQEGWDCHSRYEKVGNSCKIKTFKYDSMSFSDVKRLAENDVLDAQQELARRYFHGKLGTSKNIKKSLQWCKKAAESGFARSQYTLGRFYIDGVGVSKNYSKGIEWLTKAAEQGIDAEHQYWLAWYYAEGKVVPRSYEKAAYWAYKAYENGSEAATGFWNYYKLWNY